ncbi:MAG: hypothetical protein ABFD54_07565 [Armatimonadota bacterium]
MVDPKVSGVFTGLVGVALLAVFYQTECTKGHADCVERKAGK